VNNNNNNLIKNTCCVDALCIGLPLSANTDQYNDNVHHEIKTIRTEKSSISDATILEIYKLPLWIKHF